MLSSKLFRVLVAAGLLGGLVTFEALRLHLTRDERGTVEVPDPGIPGCLETTEAPRQQRGAAGFTEITADVRLDFQHVVGPLGTYFMPESIGAGGAMFDYDGDGRLDIYLVNCGRSPDAVGEFPEGTRIENRLFRQTPEGVFDDVTQDSGLGDEGYGAGCAVGDVNNDGFEDVYVTNYGMDRLYLNNGHGSFTDVTQAAGLHNLDWGTCAAFLDYNRDGLLDLMVVNYTSDPEHGHSIACGFHFRLISYCGPHKFQATVDRLYRNDGPVTDAHGKMIPRFTDVTESSGIGSATTCGFGVVCADLTGDEWPDIFIASDAMPNRLWVNQRNGQFVDEGLKRGVALSGGGFAEGSMGTAAGDVNADGHLDLVVTNLSQEKTTLYQSLSGQMFEDATDPVGLRSPTRVHTGWGTALADLNHDGRLDLPIVNGLVVPCHSGFPFHGEDAFVARRDVIDDPAAYWRDYADANVLLLGTADRRYRDATQEGGDFCTTIGSGRSLISGDIDNDGDLDLLVTYCGGSARLFRNDFRKHGHWLKVRPVDPRWNRTAQGAEIVVTVGDQQLVAVCSSASSYLASNDSRVHFGLGGSKHYDKIIVHWPDGPVESASEEFAGGPGDRFVELRRGQGRLLTETRE